MEEKICINCVHCIPEGYSEFAIPCRRKPKVEVVNLVTGKKRQFWPLYCNSERECGLPECCGPNGNFFQQKTTV